MTNINPTELLYNKYQESLRNEAELAKAIYNLAKTPLKASLSDSNPTEVETLKKIIKDKNELITTTNKKQAEYKEKLKNQHEIILMQRKRISELERNLREAEKKLNPNEASLPFQNIPADEIVTSPFGGKKFTVNTPDWTVDPKKETLTGTIIKGDSKATLTIGKDYIKSTITPVDDEEEGTIGHLTGKTIKDNAKPKPEPRPTLRKKFD